MMLIPFFRWLKTRDHKHCEFCRVKLSEYGKDLYEGYVTADDKRTWVCPECFEDFKEMLMGTEKILGYAASIK